MAGDESIPVWVSDLKSDMRELQVEMRGLSQQIPIITAKLESMVPMHEHLKLMADVQTLQMQNVGAQRTWTEMTKQVPILWSEYEHNQGKRELRVDWRSAAAFLVTVVSLMLGLYVAGFRIARG